MFDYLVYSLWTWCYLGIGPIDETMNDIQLTNAMREYLRAIYKVNEKRGEVTTTDISEFLHVSAASATTMIKKLHTTGYVRHTPYQGVTLTDEGRLVALRVLRRHRLLECFLQYIMKFDTHEVHDEADRLEPVVSDSFEDKMDEVLDHPTVCPHGDPIPTKDGRIITTPLVLLSEMKTGSRGVVRRVPGSHSEMLRYLQTIGMVPDAPVQVRDVGPFGGPIHVVVNGAEYALSVELCQHVHVEKTDNM